MKTLKKEELAKKNKNIPTDEIKRDIADTELEIMIAKRKIKGFKLIRDRLSMMRISSRRSGIKEREEFIEKKYRLYI